MTLKRALAPGGFPRRVIEADDIASCVAGYRSGMSKLYAKAILPRDIDDQFIADLKADGSSVATTRTRGPDNGSEPRQRCANPGTVHRGFPARSADGRGVGGPDGKRVV